MAKKKPKIEQTFHDDDVWAVQGENLGRVHVQAPDAATALRAFVAWCEDDGVTDEVLAVTRITEGVVRLKPEE